MTTTVQIVGRNGTLNTTYNGFVEVTVDAIGDSLVLLDQSHGMAAVEIIDGVGTFEVDTSETIPGDTVYFTVTGARLHTTRTSFDVP